jgi:hypothetical protein
LSGTIAAEKPAVIPGEPPFARFGRCRGGDRHAGADPVAEALELRDQAPDDPALERR